LLSFAVKYLFRISLAKFFTNRKTTIKFYQILNGINRQFLFKGFIYFLFLGSMKNTVRLRRFLSWRDKYLTPRRFTLILSFVVGLVGGLAAVLLKSLVHFIQYLVASSQVTEKGYLLYLALPLGGIFLTVLFVKYYVKDNISHGVSRILYAISRRNSNIKRHNTFSSMVASALTVGFGGSVGLEAPIVLTGSAIGSNISRYFRLNYRTTTLLLGCGAAAAIAGIFKAPIAAIIFSLEVLMLDLTMASIIPLMISAVTATVISYFLMGNAIVFAFSVHDPFVLGNLHFYILLGIFCGLISVYVTRGVSYFERYAGKIKNPFHKLFIGGIVLGMLIYFFPSLYGEGYNALKALATDSPGEIVFGSPFYGIQDNYWVFLLYLFLVLVFKVIAVAVTTGSGGVGGIFAPALFMGGISGYIFSRVVNGISFFTVSERNFTLVGMAGIMAGVMHAPLTAIFLIAEITGGYGLFIPLITTATISYITSKYFDSHSIYTDRLARKGDLITHHKDRAVLTLLKLENVIEKDFTPVKPDANLGDLVKIISKSKRNIFPVVDGKGIFHGVILLDNIRETIFNQDLYQTSQVSELLIDSPALITINEEMDSVMRKFEITGAWNLPVVNEGKYVGFISKSKIFNLYRKLLVQFSDE
jgi:chloride channel protein, CIC family